jgi:acyl carrier protein
MTSDPLVPETTQPLTETERAIATLWKQVLDTAELPSATDNFFALGGDSTAMVMVELRIKEEFLVELPAGAMLGAPSLRDLSRLIEQCSAQH